MAKIRGFGLRQGRFGLRYGGPRYDKGVCAKIRLFGLR